MLLQELHKTFGHILYQDDRHLYIDTNTGQLLTSVTTVLKKYQQPFQRDYWSKKMVNNPKKPQYAGMTQQEILDLWSKQAKLGTSSGTILHDYLENRWMNKIFPINYLSFPFLDDLEKEEYDEFVTKVNKLINHADNFLEDHKHIAPIRPELIVGNNKIAGQIDFLGYDLEENEYVIFDYKTDKKIDYNNRYQTFKKPLTHIEDCEYNKYSLQVNCYRKLLQPVLDINTMYIIWFNADNDSYIKLKVHKDDKNIDLII